MSIRMAPRSRRRNSSRDSTERSVPPQVVSTPDGAGSCTTRRCPRRSGNSWRRIFCGRSMTGNASAWRKRRGSIRKRRSARRRSLPAMSRPSRRRPQSRCDGQSTHSPVRHCNGWQSCTLTTPNDGKTAWTPIARPGVNGASWARARVAASNRAGSRRRRAAARSQRNARLR